MRQIREQSYGQDNDKYNQPITRQELGEALKRTKNGKATGFDQISYRVYKQMYKIDTLCTILILLINTIYNLAMYPTNCHLAKMILIKKANFIKFYDKMRAITIFDNLKILIAAIIHARVQPKYHAAKNPMECGSGEGE